MEDNCSLGGEHGRVKHEPNYMGNCNIEDLGHFHVLVEILPIEGPNFSYNLIVRKSGESDKVRIYGREYHLYPDKYVDSKDHPKPEEIRDLSERVKAGAIEEARKLIKNDLYWTHHWHSIYAKDLETTAS